MSYKESARARLMKGIPNWADPEKENEQIDYVASCLEMIMDCEPAELRGRAAMVARTLRRTLNAGAFAYVAGALSGSLLTGREKLRRCRQCGCTEDDACNGGCGWARIDLCTACVGIAEKNFPACAS